jgi:hypothetical protein
MLRALFPQAVFIPNQKSVHALVKFQSRTLHSEVSALIDSGATESFISPDLVTHFQIPTRTLPKPRTIRNVDGTENKSGKVTQAAELDIHYQGVKTTHTFYIISLGDDHMLLGMPFLAATNPNINWTSGTFKGKVIASSMDAHKWMPNQDSKVWKPFVKQPPQGYRHHDDRIPGEIQMVNIDPDDYLALRRSIEPELPPHWEKFIETLSTPDQFTNPYVEHKFHIPPTRESAHIRRITKATSLAAQVASQEVKPWQQLVPLEYHRYGKVFSEKESQRFPKSRPWDHAIDLIPDAPKFLDCKTYPLAEGHQKILHEFIDEHEAKGYIRRSKSPYASPFFFIKKKDGKPRPVQDYRKLNEITIRNQYPLPLIKELIRTLVKKKWFTKFDIRWGYNNVRIKEGDEWKAAFKTNRGLYEPTVMFFGLTNSPATFQTMMDAIFRDEIASGDIIIYMDDILIATEGDLNDHKTKVTHVLQKLQDNDLFLKPEKCRFHKQEVEYLGVIVGKGEVKMDPIKVQGIMDWPIPTNIHEIRSFLGFGNYYKDFIENYSAITRPLHELTKKTFVYHWGPAQEHAFNLLKELFTSYPVLRNPDPDKRYILDTDASKFAVGATLSQDYPDGRHPIGFFSKSLLPAECNYDIYDRELLAIIYAIKAFRYLLLGARHKFLIRTDHQNLKYFKSPQKITPRQARWHTFLQDYDFELIHFPGKSNTIADLLSRRKDFEGGVNPNENVTLLPESLWTRTIYLEDDPETRRQALHQIHDTPVGGHPGISNTWKLVKRKYTGPRLRQFVESYVKGCATCQESKVITHVKRAPLYRFDTYVEQGPFQYVSMDLITDLPPSNKYDAILTVVDQGCSKAAKFLPCKKTIDGQGVAKLYFRHIFPLFGIPKRIISDRDPRFTSHFAKAVCNATGIKQNLSTAFHPRTDGQSERMNQWVETYLRQFANGRQNNWSDLLPMAEFAHNSWQHEHTKHSPHELILGFNPTASFTTPEDQVPAAKDRLQELTKARSDAQKALHVRSKPMNVPRSFVSGDKVWLDSRNLHIRTPSKKLSHRRIGPYPIKEQLSPVTYRLQLPETMKINNVFHVDLLTPYHETKAYGPQPVQPPPILIDGDEEYEVEELIDDRYNKRKRKRQYLVKWKGYPASENSWVDEQDLHSDELLAEYRLSKA